jgi:SM-20-related protein
VPPLLPFKDVLAREGRVSIPEMLDEATCDALDAAFTRADQWVLSFNQGERSFDLDQMRAQAMHPEIEAGLAKRIHEYGPSGFQYAFDTCRVSDLTEIGAPCDAAFASLHKTMNGEPFLNWCRELTGDTAINYLDLQATRYRPGHFLTEHTDEQANKKRRFAYVLNMTPFWRVDWGGLLQFIGPDGHVTAGLTPSYNRMNIFKVPQSHSVSMVTPAAQGFRLSLTGWMRALPDGEVPKLL